MDLKNIRVNKKPMVSQAFIFPIILPNILIAAGGVIIIVGLMLMLTLKRNNKKHERYYCFSAAMQAYDSFTIVRLYLL